MRHRRLFFHPRLAIVFCSLVAVAVAQTASAVQVSVAYGLPSNNQTANLANVSGWIDLPVYGTQSFNTSTHVHGTIPSELDLIFNAATHAATLTGLTFVPSPGSLSFDNMSMHMAWSGFLAPTADATTNGLVGSLRTPTPPGPVTGTASPFSWDAYYHANEMDGGTVHIVGHYLGVNHPMDVNFNTPPYNTPQRCAANPGTTFGSVSISPGSPYNVWSDAASGYHETIDYATSMKLPFSISEDFAYDTGFAGTATGHIDMAGGQTGNLISTNNTTFSRTFNYLPGDANLDGTVDFTDLNAVLSNYDHSGMTWATGDFDGNGTVNFADLNTLLSYYNHSSGEPTADQIVSDRGMAVPEPSGILMLAAFGAIAAAWSAMVVAGLPGNRKAQ